MRCVTSDQTQDISEYLVQRNDLERRIMQLENAQNKYVIVLNPIKMVQTRQKLNKCILNECYNNKEIH